MNLYDKSFDIFKNNIKPNCEIKLMDYENIKEIELFKIMIDDYINSSSLSILEELFRLSECEVIFNKIWAVDKNEFIRNVYNFDLKSVYGSSFLHEFIKQIQLGQHMYLEQLYMICVVKFFKTVKSASEYFNNLIDMVKDTPSINLDQTMKQRERFIDMFKKYEKELGQQI